MQMAAGKLDRKDSAQVADYFTGLDSAGTMTLWMIIVVVFILRSVLFGSAAWPGENHKNNDDMSSGTDRSLVVHSRLRWKGDGGSEILPGAEFSAMAEIGIGNVISWGTVVAFLH